MSISTPSAGLPSGHTTQPSILDSRSGSVNFHTGAGKRSPGPILNTRASVAGSGPDMNWLAYGDATVGAKVTLTPTK